jgi:hypothetical protein
MVYFLSFLKLINFGIPCKCGARLRQIRPIGLKSAVPTVQLFWIDPKQASWLFYVTHLRACDPYSKTEATYAQYCLFIYVF